MSSKKYYEILGVAENATADEIKRAYRALAVKHHPDKGGDEAKFKEINEAYDTLKDSDKRRAYDNPLFNGRNGNSYAPNGWGMEDILREFGFNFGGGGFHQYQPRQMATIPVAVTLKEAFFGKIINTNISIGDSTHTITITIPKGVHSGFKIKLESPVNLESYGYAGLVAEISVQNDGEYKRAGDDLVKQIELSFIDALLGTTITTKTIDDKVLSVKIPENTQNGAILGISSAGMPNIHSGIQGRMLIHVNLNVPKLTTEQMEYLRKMP